MLASIFNATSVERENSVDGWHVNDRLYEATVKSKYL